MDTALTVIMPTWNKAKYVREALDSVFMQKTSYPYRVIVADDCSTDGTLDIVAEYEQSHPGVITVLRSDRNQKLFRNIVRAYAITKTPYFCVLDPDDYWCDDGKVQRALDFLEEHRDFTVYAGNSLVKGSGEDRPYQDLDREVDFTFDDYLGERGVLGQTAGAVYRNVVFGRGLPARLTAGLRADQEATYRGDAFRNLIHLHEGKAHFDPRCDAVYRVTDEGLWQGATALKRRLANVLLFLNMDEYFGYGHYGFHAMAERRFKMIVRDLPELLRDERDLEDVRSRMASFADLRRRLGEDFGDGSRQLRELAPFQRILCRLYRALRRKGERRGWA